MNNTFLFLSLMVAGTFFLGLYDIFQKKALRQGINDQLLLGMSWALSGVLLMPGLFMAGVPVIGGGFLSAFLATVFLNIISQTVFIRALQLSDASLVAPIRLLVSPLVILTGYFVLREVPTIGGTIGILTTVIGLAILMYKDASFTPKKIFFSGNKGLGLALLGSALFALSFPFDKQAVINSSGLFATTMIFFTVGCSLVALNSVFHASFRANLLADTKKWWRSLILIAVLTAIGGFLTNQALQYSLAAYASGIKRLWSLWTVILAGSFLKEQRALRRFLATAVMFLGVVMTVVFG